MVATASAGVRVAVSMTRWPRSHGSYSRLVICSQSGRRGHEQYLEGIAELLSRPGPPDQAAIIELRARYDIEQLTSMIPDRRRTAGP